MKKSLNKFTEDFIVSQRGQWDYPGLPTAVPTPTGKITTKGVKDDLIGIDNLGNSQYMTPNNEYQFEGDMVYEIPQVKKGGSKKPSKKLSRSLMAKNILFTKNQLFKKAKSVKNKIFDPNSPYFKEGGAFEIELDDAEIDEYRKGGYIIEELDTYGPGGEPCEQGFERDPVTGECIVITERKQDVQEVRTNQYTPYIAAYEEANPRDAYVYQKKADYLKKYKGLNRSAGVTQDNFNTDVEGNFNSNWEYDRNSEVIKQFAKDNNINPKNHVELVEKLADKGPVSYDMIVNSKYGSKLQPSLWARSLAGAQELGNFIVKQLPGEQGDVLNIQTPGLTKKEWKDIHDSNFGALQTFSAIDIPGAVIGNSIADLSTASGGNYQESPGILSGELKSNMDPLKATLLNPFNYSALVKGLFGAQQGIQNLGKLLAKEKSLPASPNSFELFDLNNVRKPSGSIGNQGATPESANKILQSLNIKVKGAIPNEVTLTEMVEHLKNNPKDAAKYKKFLENEPISVSELPGGEYQINDGHHRATLSYYSGNENIPAIIKNKGEYITQLPGSPNAVDNAQKAGFLNPLALLDRVTPRLPAITKVLGMEDDVVNYSPFNLIPGYGKKLAQPGFTYPINSGNTEITAYRKFGNSLDDLKNSKTFRPQGGFRMGANQIKKEGNWAESGIANENYKGVFAAGMDPRVAGTNIQLQRWSRRNGVVGMTKQGNPAIPITDPGLNFHRRLPFSNRYVPIDKQKLIDNKFQLATQLPHVQSLIEKYGITAAYALVFGYMSDGKEGAIENLKTVNKYTVDPVINWSKTAWDDLENKLNQKEEGGSIQMELDDAEIDEYRKRGYIVEELDAYAKEGNVSKADKEAQEAYTQEYDEYENLKNYQNQRMNLMQYELNKKQFGGLNRFVGGGEPCPDGFEYVDGNCVEKSSLENCEDGRCEETDQIQKILDEGSYIPKKNINMMWDVVGEMDKRDPFGNAGKIWTGKGAQSLSKRLGMDNPSNCMWAAGMGYQCLPETKGKLPLMPFESNDKFINAVNKGTIPFSRVAKTHDPNFASQETGMLQQGDIINFKGAGNSHAMTFSNYREDGVPIFLDSNGNATDFGFNTGLWKDFLPNKEKVAYVSRFNPEKFYEKDIKALEEKARNNPTMIEKQFGGTIAGTEGLTDNFSQRLSQFILDARTQGIDLNVGSGYRSYEKQKKLWEQALKKYGSPEKARKWVAPPGSSNHNKGLAVDLSSNGLFLGKDKNVKATEWAHANAKKYGLNFRMGWEPWHIEPLEKGNSKDDGKTADDHDHSSEFGNDETTKKEKLDLAIKNKELEFENKKLLLAEQEKIKNDDDYSNWTPRKKIEDVDPTKALLENYSKIINPSLQNINNIYTSNLQGQMKRGGFIMELDDNEIKKYIDGGYVVKEIN